jgi:predicted aspartyl protease
MPDKNIVTPIEVRGFTRTFPGPLNEIRSECGLSHPSQPKKTDGSHIVKTIGLWDTGATGSSITQAIAQQLGLIPIGKAISHHAGGSSTVKVYLIDIHLPNNVTLNNVQVSECIETVGRFGILIGMDVITRGDFAISNHNGKTTISFRMPSVMPIDLGKHCLPERTINTETGQPVTGHNYPRNQPCYCGSGKKFKHCHGKT